MTLGEWLAVTRNRWRSITELMQGRAPGEIRIHKIWWPADYFFIPFFLDKRGIWHGLDSQGLPERFASSKEFQLYEKKA